MIRATLFLRPMSLKIYCIDIGNTRTHCATLRCASAEDFEVLESESFPSSAFAGVFRAERLFEKSGASALAWCSVVPSYSESLRADLDGVDAMQLGFEISPVPIGLKNPAKVGQDRIADVVGASLLFNPPYVVVDMGTAVTIDLVDASGVYVGGAIAPGMHAFVSYLGERAAQLPRINPHLADFSMTIGRDTEEAMQVGCVKGFCRLIDGVMSDIAEEFFPGESVAEKTVFTGGSVDLLPKKWLAGRKIECNLAQLGLARSFILNRKLKI